VQIIQEQTGNRHKLEADISDPSAHTVFSNWRLVYAIIDPFSSRYVPLGGTDWSQDLYLHSMVQTQKNEDTYSCSE
jgi:hypothetical protein